MSSIDACREWLQESVDEAGAGQPIVLRLWDHVYRSRRDLQLAFRDHLGVDREAFVEWTQLLGVDECGVDPSLLEQPVRR